MRIGKKLALWAFCAVPAATMLVAGAGAASAAPLYGPHNGPGNYGSHCNPWQREQWDVGGNNTVNLTYQGKSYTYAVTLHEHGSCLSGTLTDAGLAAGSQNLAVTGDINGNHLSFSVTYPNTGNQGTRTFDGYINRWGHVSGWWNETGTENGSGTWSLQYRAHPACWGHHGWIYNTRGCHVWS